jgi:hypothetical protein
MSTTDCDADIIKIQTDVFKKYYKKEKHNIPDSLLMKKQEIYGNNCFHMNYESYQERKINTHHYNNTNKPSKTLNRLYIITSDFTEDANIKKQFTSYLNKLTPSNKNIIYPKFKELLDSNSNNDKSYDIIWEFIKKSPEHIYLDLLKLYDSNITVEYVNNYVQNKVWIPPKQFFNNNLLESSEEVYDLYCDYVKWRKYTSNTIRAIVTICTDKGLVEKLLQDLYEFFCDNFTNHIKHLVDFSLEQINFIIKTHQAYKISENIKQFLKSIDLNKTDSSSKFLIIDIIS